MKIVFLQNNMGVTTLQVESFKMTFESQHKMAVDPDLTLLTIRIEGGFSSTTNFSLFRPDGRCLITKIHPPLFESSILFCFIFCFDLLFVKGTIQAFNGSASVDLIGRTTVISVQVSYIQSLYIHVYSKVFVSILYRYNTG